MRLPLSLCASLVVFCLASLPALAVLEITEIEVTQGIQNADNDVRLFTGRTTTARVYPFDSKFKPVRRIGGYLESPRLNGAPLLPARASCVNRVNTTNTYALAQMRANAGLALMCPIPASWVRFSGALQFDAVADSPTAAGPPARRSVFVEVHNDSKLTVELLPIRDRCTGPCTAANGPTAKQMRLAMAHLMDLFPVSRLNLIVAPGWLPEHEDKNAGGLKRKIFLADQFRGTYGQKLPFTGLDRIRLGFMRKGARFERVGGGADPLNGSCDAESRSGFVMLGTDDPRVTAAHETGHCIGMRHIPDKKACPLGTGPPDCESYPYHYEQFSDAGVRDHYGWDNAAGGIAPYRGDIMSYQDDRWISDFSYLKIACLLENLTLEAHVRQTLCGTPTPAPDEPLSRTSYDRYVILTMSLDSGAAVNAELQALAVPGRYLVRPGEQGRETGHDAAGSHAAVLLGGDGSLLLDHRFTPVGSHFDASESPVESQQANLVLPLDPELGQIRLVDLEADQVVAVIDVSASAPVVEADEELVPTVVDGEELVVFWSAGDADGDALSAHLLLSEDGGETWQPAAIDLDALQGRAHLDTTQWPATEHGMLALLVSDGIHTSETLLGPFAVPDKAPSLDVEAPSVAQLRSGLPLEMRAFAFDPEDGPLDGESVSWTSSRDGFLGTGAVLWVPVLRPGRHVIEVTARDGAGQTAVSRIVLRAPAARGRGAKPLRVIDDPIPEVVDP